MAAGGKSDDGSPDPATLALRIATVALSVASAAMMASASQCSCASCSPWSQVSYTDFSSLTYSFAVTIITAAVQAGAAWMKANGKEGESKAAKSLAELIDIVSQVFLYSSSALSLSVEDFGTCGHRVAGVCKSSGGFCFCQRVRGSGIVSMVAAITLAASKYLKDVPVSTWFKGDKPKHKKAKPACGRGCHCHH